MRTRIHSISKLYAGLDLLLLGALLMLTLAMLAIAFITPARAGEIIPQIGLTGTPGSSDQAKSSYGLALRGRVLPSIDAEIAGGYRSEPVLNGAANMVQWPVTASLWARPFGGLYVGGGVGTYRTTLEYAGAPIPNTTTQKFGAHLGGGFEIPVVPGAVSVDLNARYVYLGNQTSALPPTQWKADFWTTTAGLAFHF
jgi:hypothetical protein